MGGDGWVSLPCSCAFVVVLECKLAQHVCTAAYNHPRPTAYSVSWTASCVSSPAAASALARASSGWLAAEWPVAAAAKSISAHAHKR
jgi:hypothetical protein